MIDPRTLEAQRATSQAHQRRRHERRSANVGGRMPLFLLGNYRRLLRRWDATAVIVTERGPTRGRRSSSCLACGDSPEAQGPAQVRRRLRQRTKLANDRSSHARLLSRPLQGCQHRRRHRSEDPQMGGRMPLFLLGL
jgi:hypothetical protein